MSINNKIMVYLAAPLFNNIEREFNVHIAEALKPYANVFLPQRDGLLLKKLVADGLPVADARALVFENDTKAIEKSDILVAVLDGRTIDEGVAFELGYARALQKTCIGLKTDDRVMLPTGDNPMIVSGCHKIFADPIELISVIRSHAISINQFCLVNN